MQAPLHALDNPVKIPENPILPGFPNPALAILADSVVSGTTALNALIDVKGGKIYISHLGDVRAVAGRLIPSTRNGGVTF